MRSRMLISVSILLITIVVGVSAQNSQIPLSSLSISNVEISDEVIFENESFTLSFSLLNNGSVDLANVLVKVSEQKVSTRPGEDAASIPIASTSIPVVPAGSHVNVSVSVQSTAGSKLLLLSVVINNIETPPLASAPVEILSEPTGDVGTTLSFLGYFMGSVLLFLSLQWFLDIVRLKFVRY